MSNVMELSLRGTSALEKLMRTVLLDSENKVPAERLRIVGALSEGAVMESGSNANGDWVRFANGMQICIMQDSVSVNGSSARGDTFTFPAAFITSCKLVVTPRGYISSGLSGTITTEAVVLGTSTYSVKILLLKVGGEIAAINSPNIFFAIAIGRWK